MAMTRARIGILPVAYIVAGIIAAAHYHYFQHVNTAKQVGSAILAVALWWLLLLGINLHIK